MTTNSPIIAFSSGYSHPTGGGTGNAQYVQVAFPFLGLRALPSSTTTQLIQKLSRISLKEVNHPTNPITYEESIELHSRIAAVFLKYDIKDIDSSYMHEYLNLSAKELRLLNWLPSAIKSIFGDVEVALNSVVPIEPGDPKLEVRIASELPLDDEFDRKESALFKSIDDLSLADALGSIVITYA